MKRLSFLLVFLLLAALLLPFAGSASGPLDELESYTVIINPRNDGSLDMEFEILWRVLDSDSEGPLEWVKIGIPNYHCDELRALDPCIDEISYYSDGGAYVRLDLDRAYYEGETVNLHFSLHQSHMYIVSEGIVSYGYTPGWFDSAEVKSLKIFWLGDAVKNSDAQALEGDYLYWETGLYPGERFTVNVVYNSSVFSELDYGSQYSEDYDSPMTAKEKVILVFVALFFVLLVVVIIVAAVKSYDPYKQYRGFGGTSYRAVYGGTHILYYPGVSARGVVFGGSPGTGGGRGGGGGCACACACACAGGGRAGCSMKDFYGTNLRSDMINKVCEDKKV
jgi:hypothetical protein